MLKHEVEAFLGKVAEDGTPENKLYKRWRTLPTTRAIVDVMQYMSTPSQASEKIAGLPGTGEDGACAILGFCVGMSKAIEEMMTLDSSIRIDGETKEPEESFETQA